MAKFDLKEYARRGAEARAAELQSELAAIYRAFPDLRSRGAGRPAETSASSDGSTRTRRRRKMTAAQKKAVSTRMKKYWAERRSVKAAR